MQFEVVRFVVSETNIDQSPTDIGQTLLDAATVKGHCEIIRFFVFPAMKTMWVDLRRSIGPESKCWKVPWLDHFLFVIPPPSPIP